MNQSPNFSQSGSSGLDRFAEQSSTWLAPVGMILPLLGVGLVLVLEQTLDNGWQGMATVFAGFMLSLVGAAFAFLSWRGERQRARIAIRALAVLGILLGLAGFGTVVWLGGFREAKVTVWDPRVNTPQVAGSLPTPPIISPVAPGSGFPAPGEVAGGPSGQPPEEIIAMGRVHSQFMQRMKELGAAYRAAVQKTDIAGIMLPANLHTKEDIQAARERVKAYRAAVLQCTNFVAGAQGYLRAELKKAKVPDDKADAMVNGFLKNLGPQLEVGLKSYKCDLDVVSALYGMLEIYEKNLGKFQYDESKKATAFPNRVTSEAFSRLCMEAHNAAMRQAKLQGAPPANPPGAK